MFYCNRCAELNDWPETGFKSRGKCEICGHVRDCNDLPSSALPMPLDDEDRKRHAEQRRKIFS